MRIRKKSMALILSVALVITMIPASASLAYADAGSGSAKSAGGDAFSAIGIDTSVAPDGYDADSIDNPYGRDTIKVNTVSELYTVELDQDVNTINADSADAGTGKTPAAGETDTKTVNKQASVQANLYGDGSGLTTLNRALGTVKSGAISSGDVSATGNYVKLNTGTHSYNKDSDTYGNYSYVSKLTGLNNATSEQGVMSDVAAGNFDGNKTGKSAQIARVYTKAYSAKGGFIYSLVMRKNPERVLTEHL